jgi:nicotinate dehydrogenase subunit B
MFAAGREAPAPRPSVNNRGARRVVASAEPEALMRANGALVAGLCALATLLAVMAAASRADTSADPAAVARGAALAKIGGCGGCHTPQNGQAFSGGRPIGTPFGAVHSTNITPDAETGIGRWSLADFRRAMRDGTAPGGKQLYPAFPYDHFTRATDQDIADLYAFLQSRPPARATPTPNQLVFPANLRPVLILWKALYFRHGQVRADPAQSGEWNRGHYLVESLGHCGGCHTPRNSLGAEHWEQGLAGGWVGGWYAPPLDAASPAAAPWTVEALDAYLTTGLSQSHAAAAGPMGGVVHELAEASPADVRAIAVYIATQIGHRGRPANQPEVAAKAHPEGARLYASACAECHDTGAPTNAGNPDLSLGTALHEADPRDTLQVILQGLKPPPGRPGPTMPAYESLSDAQVAEVTAYLRARFTEEAPWPDLPKAVAKARKAKEG